MKNEDISLYLRVLGYAKSDNSWAAHCLETDIVGYGASFKEALDNLIELTEMQVTFAVYKNQPALLDRPAPIEIIETYQQILRKKLQLFTTEKKTKSSRQITSIPWPNHLSNPDFAIAQM